jgi:uncharacterized protein YdeI (YjbR/CyaY-like superfamily)
MPATPDSLSVKRFATEDAWEKWLEANHGKSTGLWLKISKKGASTSSVTYAEALDVALCFGWIDGQKKSYDEEHFLQKFTPRRKRSLWSKRNVEKVEALTKAGRMQPAGQAEVNAAQADGRWQQAYASSNTIEVPEDFQKALNKNAAAKAFFATVTKAQRYSFLWRIETAKKAETRERRIREYVELLANQKTL